MDVSTTLNERYSALKSKYPNLPSLEELNTVIELEDSLLFDKFVPTHLLRLIRRRFVSHFDRWTSYLHGIVMPGNQNMILYEESSKFTEEEKQAVMEQMKKIMAVSRQTILLELIQDEAKDAEYIVEAYRFYKEISAEMLPFAERSLEIWQHQTE